MFCFWMIDSFLFRNEVFVDIVGLVWWYSVISVFDFKVVLFVVFFGLIVLGCFYLGFNLGFVSFVSVCDVNCDDLWNIVGVFFFDFSFNMFVVFIGCFDCVCLFFGLFDVFLLMILIVDRFGDLNIGCKWSCDKVFGEFFGLFVIFYGGDYFKKFVYVLEFFILVI